MSPFKYPFIRYQVRNAMRQGKLHEVDRLLRDKDLFEPDLYDETTLFLACASGNKGMVDIVLKQLDYLPSCPVSLQLGETHLHVAAELGFEDIAETLLQWGADIFSSTDDGISPLQLAALSGHEGVVRLLIKHGANVKDKDNHGFTALHMTCIDGHCELVRVLIDAGANVNEPSKEGIAPLHIAAEQGHTWMVRELIESGAEIDVLTRGHYTSLDRAVMNDRIEVVTVLIELGASLNGNRGGSGTPLHHALYKQDYSLVQILLDRGAEVDSKALLIACDSSNNPDDRVVHLLLAHGADVTVEDVGGHTALHYALSNSRKAIVELLLEHGADVNHLTQGGHSPLQVACRRAVYSPRTVMTLLEYGADFTSEDEILRCCYAYFDADADTEYVRYAMEPLDVFELFFTKLQTADLCSPDEIYVYPPGLYPTLNRDFKEKYRRVCAMEVSSMKKKTIGSSGVSFYWFLRRTDALCRNDELTGALPKDFRAHFPHYGQILNVRIRKALCRRKLIDSSYSAFARLMKFDFPTLVTDRVFSFLNDKDLENLIEVGKTVGEPAQGCGKILDDFLGLDSLRDVLGEAFMECDTRKRPSGTRESEELAGDVRIIKKPRFETVWTGRFE